MTGTIEITGTGGIIEGNLGAANVNVNLDVPYTAIHETFGSGTPQTITIPHDNDLDGSSAYTFMAWVKSSATSATTGAGGTGNASFGTIAQINDSWKFGIHDSGKPYFFWYGSSTVSEYTWGNAFSLVGTGWTHVCVVVNTSGGTVNGHANNTATLYQNGVARSGTLTVGGNCSDEGGNILIHSKAYNDEILYGNIMDVKLYNAILSADEVKIAASKINIDSTLVSSTAPQIWAKLNTGATGSVASAIGGTATVGSGFSDTNDYDAFSVNVHDGGTATTSGNFTVTQGTLECKALSSVDLNGSSEYIAVSDAAGLSYGDGSTDTPFTMSAWVRMDDATRFEIISKGEANSQFEYLFFTNGSDKFSLILADESVTDCWTGQQTTATVTSYENQWVHLTATYSGDETDTNNGIALYINGVAQAIENNHSTESSYVAMENGTAALWIGRYENHYADGEIRDVRIYDYNLSADQVSSLYFGSYNVVPKNWWKIDEGYTTEATVDASGAFEDSGTGTDADGTGTNLDADSCQNGTLDLDEESSILTIGTDGDSVVKGTVSAPRGVLLTQQDFKNFGSYIHNNGTIEFNGNGSTDINEDSNCVDTTFFNVKHSSPSDDELTFRMYTNFTIEGTLTNAGTDGDIRFATYSADKTVTFGTSTSAGAIVNSSSNTSKIEFSGNTTYQTTFQAANSLYPFTVTGTDFDWDSGGSGSKVSLSGVDYDPDITTGGGGVTITLTGDCEFDAVTVSNGDTFDMTGQRVVIGGLSSTGTGTIDAENALVYLNGRNDTYAYRIHDNGTFTSTGSTFVVDAPSDAGCQMQPTGNTLHNVMFSRDCNLNGGELKATGFVNVATNDLATANNNITAVDVTIPTGGTLTAGSSTITASGDFTTSGGLIGESCLKFEGTDDVVTIPISASQNDHIKGAFADGIFTVEGWIKLESDFTDGVWVNKNTEFSVHISRGSSTQWALADGASWNFSANPFTMPNLEDGKWHHLAFSRRNEAGNQGYYDIYVDGKLEVVHKVASTGLWTANDDDLYVGAYNGSSAWLVGHVENVRIWGTARTQAQIRADMFNSTPTSSASDCIANFTFNEGTGTAITASDPNTMSSNETAGTYNGAWAGAGTYTYGTSTLVMTGSSKKINVSNNMVMNALTINGTILINDISGVGRYLEPQDTFTVGGSGTLGSTGSEYLIFDNSYTGGAGESKALVIGNSANALANLYKIRLAATAGTLEIPTCTIPRITNTDSAGRITAQGNWTITTDLNISAGAIVNSNGYDITTKTVTNAGTLNLENGSTLTFTDVSGCGFGSSAGALNCRGAKAISFDGDDDYITVADHSSLDIDGDISLSAWVYVVKELGAFQTIVSKASGCDNQTSPWQMRIDSDDKLEFVTGNGSGGTTRHSSTNALADGWNHIVITCDEDDASSVVKYYINGVLDKTQSGSWTSMHTNSNAVTLGTLGPNSCYRSRIVLSDVRIYNKVLTDGGVSATQTATGEIATLYNSGSNPAINADNTYADSSDALGAVAWWKLNESNFPTNDAADSSSNSNTGSVTSADSSTGITITSSAGGAPTNFWDMETTMTVTAAHTTFTKYHDFIIDNGSSNTITIDNCTFTEWRAAGQAFWADNPITWGSFTNNTWTHTGTPSAGIRFDTAYAAFDNINLSGCNFASGTPYDVKGHGVKLEFTNSNFDFTNVSTSSGGSVISKDHNDTDNLYEIEVDGSLSYSTVTNEFSTDADVKIRAGTLTMNEDNKVCDTVNVFSGATIRITDNNDLYVQGVFDNDGTWDQTAGYGGDIHVGDFTPFDSGDILDNTDFVDTGFHDTSHYLEMDL